MLPEISAPPVYRTRHCKASLGVRAFVAPLNDWNVENRDHSQVRECSRQEAAAMLILARRW